MQIFVKLLL